MNEKKAYKIASIEKRARLLHKNGKDTLYIQKHLGLSFKEVMAILYPEKPTPVKRIFLKKDIKTRNYKVLGIIRYSMSDGSYDYCFNELRIIIRAFATGNNPKSGPAVYDTLYWDNGCINAKNIKNLKTKIERKHITKKKLEWFKKVENRRKWKFL